MRSHNLSVAVALALLLVTSPPALADDYDDAATLLKQGKTAAALTKVNAAIAANQNDARARFLKGLILTEQGDTKEAIDVFKSLTRDFPELPEPYNNLAVLYAAQGQYDKARESLEQAIRTHPSYAVAHENLGDVYAKMASEAYDKALSLDSNNQTAQTKLSLIRELFSESAQSTRVAAASSAAPEKPQAAATQPSDEPEPTPATPAEAAAPKEASGPVPSTQQQESDVIAAVTDWAHAWSEQDVAAYLSHYGPDFAPPGKLSRSAWEKQRQSRVSGPKSIHVDVSEPSVTFNGADKATVRFTQHYQSDSFDSTGYKTLTMVRSGSQWLIVAEQFED